MLPHRIHLKGPWQYEWLDPSPQPREERSDPDTGRFAAEGRAKMPITWQSLFADQRGKVRFRRRFGRPTNLEPHERVFLVFEGTGGAARVTLNDGFLGTIDAEKEAATFDVTDFLNPSNQLTVEIEFDPAHSHGRPGGLWGPVAIEIRSESESPV